MARLAQDTYLVPPASTDEDWLSYTDVQNHPGNGVAAEYDAATGAVTIQDAVRFSVARTRRGYATPTAASAVRSITPGMRQAYGAETGTAGTVPDIDRGPYTF